tara:strand:- start:1356 stop:1565 length:210 start_codon:yes stop_codon:yes gene_type:complete
MKRKRRKAVRLDEDGEKKIVKYYFDNPQNNSMRALVDKFKIPEARISRIISANLEERLKNSKVKKWLEY